MKYTNNIPKFNKEFKEKLKRTAREIGVLTKAESQLRCPVLTGKLRRSIAYKTSLKEYKVMIGSALEYAPLVHEGSTRNVAKPFVKQAVMDNVENIKRITEEFLK